MIYLDYAANTPVNEEVIQAFSSATIEYVGNPNSSHRLGKKAKVRLDEATEKIQEILRVKDAEIIYTSGATESNNLAIKGIAGYYNKYGKHMITTYLEHSSVTGAFSALNEKGYDIDFVNVLDDGLVDLEHLKMLLREDTILVSICYVDSEVGIQQNINEIGMLLKEYSHCYYHVDATQAIGKIETNLTEVDLTTCSAHKFYGLNGSGLLIRKESVQLEPLIHGGLSNSLFRSGTPTLSLAVATQTALELSVEKQTEHFLYVKKLNLRLQETLNEYDRVQINSSKHSIPFILNISLAGVKTSLFLEELEQYEIYLSSKSACCAVNTPSRPVYAMTKNRKIALSTIRISLSHLTSEADIDSFLECFDICYKKFTT